MQNKVVSLAQNGMSIAEIAIKLSVAEGTVRMHVQQFFNKQETDREYIVAYERERKAMPRNASEAIELRRGYAPPKYYFTYVEQTAYDAVQSTGLKLSTVAKHVSETNASIRLDIQMLKEFNK